MQSKSILCERRIFANVREIFMLGTQHVSITLQLVATHANVNAAASGRRALRTENSPNRRPLS